MSRYTINIGDEFPLHDEAPGATNRRIGFGLRALFVLAVAVIVLNHPFQALILIGLALLVRRSRVFGEMRARWHAQRREWRDHRPRGPKHRDEPGEHRRDRYKAFV